MRDLIHVPVRHMAARAIIGWGLAKTKLERQRAAPLCVAAQAFLPVVRRSLLFRGLNMWIVAGQATKPATARPVTLAQYHGKVVLQEIRPRGGFPLEGNEEYRLRVVQRSPGAEIEITFSRLKHPSGSTLMTVHA